jgi:hypothetical protein
LSKIGKDQQDRPRTAGKNVREGNTTQGIFDVCGESKCRGRAKRHSPIEETIPVRDKIVALVVNGAETQLKVAPRMTSLDALHDQRKETK